MKKILFNLFAVLHIGIIVLVSISSSYTVCCEYYEKKVNKKAVTFLNSILGARYIALYARYSGTESGYGFFAPNVKSPYILSSECNNQMLQPAFSSYEGAMRGNCLSSVLSEFLFDMDKRKKNSNAAEDNGQKFEQLIMKNIAVSMLNKNLVEADSVTIALSMLKYPSLKECRQGASSKDPKVYTISELKFNTR